jgi:hypothetical protein
LTATVRSESSHAAVEQRVRERTLSERKRRVALNAVLVVIVTGGMILAAMAQRDTQAIRSARRLCDDLAAGLQLSLAREGRATVRMPDLGERTQVAQDIYRFNPFYADMVRIRSPIGVFGMREPLDLYLREEGRFVVLFDGTRYEAAWLAEKDYQGQARDLGFGGGR